MRFKKKSDLYLYPIPINVLLYIENMGGTPSCDSLDECPIRACNFSKHTSGEIDVRTDGIPADEKDDRFKDEVNGMLGKFLVDSSIVNANSITNLSSAITSKNTPTMDIGTSCIGFKNAVKTEKFTHKRSLSLIGCTIASILVIAVAILIWRFFVSKGSMQYQRSTAINMPVFYSQTN